MRVHYTGRKASISDKQKQKLQVKFDKIDRILSPKDSLEAHVILSRQRHLCEAEVTLRALSHTLVVTASNAEPLSALLAAVDKLSKQAVKNKHKLIDVRRHERQHGERSPRRRERQPCPRPHARSKSFDDPARTVARKLSAVVVWRQSRSPSKKQ